VGDALHAEAREHLLGRLRERQRGRGVEDRLLPRATSTAARSTISGQTARASAMESGAARWNAAIVSSTRRGRSGSWCSIELAVTASSETRQP
jgi:hypothetical protein